MSRRIYLDTEGNSGPPHGRVVELAMVEVVNGSLTGRTWKSRFRPLRPHMDPHAYRIHGISYEALRNEPRFSEKAREILEFIGGSMIFAHGAESDKIMMKLEFQDAGMSDLFSKLKFFDTLKYARKVLPGPKFNLDIFTMTVLGTARSGDHGALEDATLLARVMEKVSPPLDSDLEEVSRILGRNRAARAMTIPDTPAIPAFIGDGINKGVAERIALTKTPEDAFSLRSGGRDLWSNISGSDLDETLERLTENGGARLPIEDLADHFQDAALRWIGRGLSRDLSFAMIREFSRRAAEAMAERGMEP